MFRPADCRRAGITLTLSTLILAACLASNRSLTAADRPTNKDAPPSQSKIDHFDLICFAPDHPVVVRFRIRIGSNGIREFRHRYAMQLFRTLDRKRDNFLTRSEVTQVERLGEIASRFRTLPKTWKDFDTTPTDDRLSPIEFARVVEGALGPSFAVSVPSQGATRSAKLFTRLDADSDGELDSGEIHNGTRHLKRLDINDDETFSVEELDPLQYQAIRAESQPFVALLTANHQVLCDRLIAFYGRVQSPGTTATLASRQLGLTAEQWRPTLETLTMVSFLPLPAEPTAVGGEWARLSAYSLPDLDIDFAEATRFAIVSIEGEQVTVSYSAEGGGSAMIDQPHLGAGAKMQVTRESAREGTFVFHVGEGRVLSAERLERIRTTSVFYIGDQEPRTGSVESQDLTFRLFPSNGSR